MGFTSTIGGGNSIAVSVPETAPPFRRGEGFFAQRLFSERNNRNRQENQSDNTAVIQGHSPDTTSILRMRVGNVRGLILCGKASAWIEQTNQDKEKYIQLDVAEVNPCTEDPSPGFVQLPRHPKLKLQESENASYEPSECGLGSKES